MFQRLFLLIFVVSSCQAQNNTAALTARTEITTTSQPVEDDMEAHKEWKENFIFPKLFTVNSDPSLEISQYIRRMFEDQKGNIWFGTQGDGACLYDGRTFRYFGPKQGFSGEVVRGIVQDGSGKIWFATNHGVSRLDPALLNSEDSPFNDDGLGVADRQISKAFTNYSTKDGLPHNDIWSILKDSKGNIWLGTMAGVCRFDGKSFHSFPILRSSFASNSRFSPDLAWAITEDNAGNIWFGMDGGGLKKYDGKTMVTYSMKDGLPDNNISSILQDKKGNLWFATRNAGVSKLEPGAQQGIPRFKNIDQKNGLCHDFIWTIFEDRKGEIWFGSAGGGVSRFDGKTFMNYSDRDGLENRHVQSILEDQHGNLWFGTSGGVYRFNWGPLPDGKDRFFHFTKPGC